MNGARAADPHLLSPVKSLDAGGVGSEELGGEVPQRADHRRLDQLDLAAKVVLARLDLVGVRIAVIGRTALEHIGDEHIAALEPDLPEQLVEQLARLTDEGKALAILVGARSLADEHQI